MTRAYDVVVGTGGIGTGMFLALQGNHTLARATGYPREEILGRPVFDLYHPDCLGAARRAFEQSVAAGARRGGGASAAGAR